MKRTVARLTGAVTAALLTSGCLTSDLDKSGGQPYVHLTLASNDYTLDFAPAVAKFVEAVEQLSGGRVTVEVVLSWKGRNDEAGLLRDVAAGEADLGWSGTRAFDLIGVDAFQPLHAPFLIPSHRAEAAVVSSPAGTEMLTAVRPVGLEGLALLADDLRWPAAAAAPLLEPENFENLRFGTFPSQVQSTMLTALGASPTTLSHPHPENTDGLDAVETMWSTYVNSDQAAFVPYVTGNVALWPRTAVLVGNAARLDRLDDEARGWLDVAAAQAAGWSLEHAGDREASEIAQACDAGARVATATPAQRVRLRAAAEPAYRIMRADPATAEILAELESIVATAGPAPDPVIPPGCAYTPGEVLDRPVAAPPRDEPGRPGSFPPGTYRFTITADELRSAGWQDKDWIDGNAGVWTWTLGDGRWSYVLEPSAPEYPTSMGGLTCAGYYDSAGDSVAFTRTAPREAAGGECSPQEWSGRFKAVPNGVRWVTLDVGGRDLEDLWGSKTWERIR